MISRLFLSSLFWLVLEASALAQPARSPCGLPDPTCGSTLPNIVQASPGNPTGTSSTTAVMMGLAVAYTPKVTGTALVIINGTIANASAIADGGKVQIYYGTGTAPANAASLTGTAAGAQVSYVAATTAEVSPFSLSATITGLSSGTPVWVDVSLAAITGGTAALTNLSVSVVEVR